MDTFKTLRSDGKSFRVNNSTIPKSDANSVRKMKTDFADLNGASTLRTILQPSKYLINPHKGIYNG